MINVRPDIENALKNDATLVTLLGGQRIYFLVAPDVTVSPYITFFEIDNVGELHADDIEISSQIHVQIDIWSRGSMTAIINRVDLVMTSIGYSNTGTSPDLYEMDTKFLHKGLRYVISKPTI